MEKKVNDLLQNVKDTKEKLLILALYYYYVKGAHDTHFQMLADHLEISQAAIYKHYKNKEDLLVHAINYAAEKGREIINVDENPDQSSHLRLKNYIKKNLEFCVNHRLYAVALITMHYFAICLPEVLKLHEEINSLRISKIEGYLYQAKSEKVIESANIKQSAAIIHSLLMGEMIKAYLWPKDKTIQQRQLMIWKNIELLLKIDNA